MKYLVIALALLAFPKPALAADKTIADMVNCFGNIEGGRARLSCLDHDNVVDKKVAPIKIADFPTVELQNLAMISFMKDQGFHVLAIVPNGVYFTKKF